MRNISFFLHLLIWLPTVILVVWRAIVGYKYVKSYRREHNLLKKNELDENIFFFFLYNPQYIYNNKLNKKQENPELEKLRTKLEKITWLAAFTFIATVVILTLF